MTYYVMDHILNPMAPDEGPFLDIEPLSVPGATSWSTGARFTHALPAMIEIRAVPYRGFEGAPYDYFDGQVSFMSARMAQALARAGADNMDLYPALVTYTTTGKQYPVLAFNLLGLVFAADSNGSDLASYDLDYRIDTSIRGFKVDPARARGLSLFRLGENCGAVLVHANLRAALQDAGLNGVAFIRPEDWVQL